MAYSSRYGKRPMENASRSSHSFVIRDPVVQAFLKDCNLPKSASDVDIPEEQIVHCVGDDNPIQHFIAIDGGYTEVVVRTEFPSATICFFQFGALFFSAEDLQRLEEQPFIDPTDMAKLKNIQRLKFVLPVRNVSLSSQGSLTHSVRRALYDFFRQSESPSILETLRWFIFREYRGRHLSEWLLSSCPICGQRSIHLRYKDMSDDCIFKCEHCGKPIYLTDVFRLHEAIDDELGAGGILGYVTTTIEQVILVHLIHTILQTKPSLLKHLLFVKDGPLAFFGQTANMHKPMRALARHLFAQHDLYLAGLEKSGPFVEHADEIANKMESNTAIILDDDYIYRYVIPSRTDSNGPYGRTTYYGNKLIFKTQHGAMYVVTVPTTKVLEKPGIDDLRNLQVILANLEGLRCDMYDNALIPIALANKLVSLANHPSSRILQIFAQKSIQH